MGNLRCPSRLELKSKLGAQAEIHLGHRNLRCPRRNSSWAPQLTVPKPAGIKIRIRRPSRNSSWAPQLTVPKKEFILGTATYGAQEGIHLGHRNLRCPRSAWSWGKIQNFMHALSEMGNAKKKVFCTVLLPKFDLTYLQQTLFLIISTIFHIFRIESIIGVPSLLNQLFLWFCQNCKGRFQK